MGIDYLSLTSVWCLARANRSWKSWPHAAQCDLVLVLVIWLDFKCFFKMSDPGNVLLQMLQWCCSDIAFDDALFKRLNEAGVVSVTLDEFISGEAIKS